VPAPPHTLLVLDPGHFHAALTLRVPQARVADEVFVYAREGAELRDFLALVERFNQRTSEPTRWRVTFTTSSDPLARLIEERRGNVVVLAGRNGGKARTMRRLHEADFHVLADKPWLVEAADLEHVKASLAGWPLAAEIMTGRHDAAARLVKRLVGAPVFGAFRADGPAIEQESVHHLEKLVDGAPLRRPSWYFDVRVQGSGPVDIPTHVVDQAQWLVNDDAAAPLLLSARAWETPVPVEVFRRITGEAGFPPELAPFVDGDTLRYRCNAELVYRIGRVTARAATRWDLGPPPAGGGDTSRLLVHGTRADVRLEQSARTDHRRRIFVEPCSDAAGVERALRDAVNAWQSELPGADVVKAGSGAFEVTVPFDGGHETHFARALDEFLGLVAAGRWPAALAERTLAKYTLLAEAAARTASAS